MNAQTQTRTLATIARDIKSNWARPYFGAVPYIDAMATMATVNENYGLDDGRGIVRYFLANAGTWRGPVARDIKAELRGLVEGK
jgi:hypothetical protein